MDVLPVSTMRSGVARKSTIVMTIIAPCLMLFQVKKIFDILRCLICPVCCNSFSPPLKKECPIRETQDEVENLTSRKQRESVILKTEPFCQPSANCEKKVDENIKIWYHNKH